MNRYDFIELKLTGLQKHDELIQCYFCEQWGFNRGKILTSDNRSYCKDFKCKTFCDEYCKKFLLDKKYYHRLLDI